MGALAHITFQNLILESNVDNARFRRGKANDNSLIPPTPEVKDELRKLFGVVDELYRRNPEEPDFGIEFGGNRFRASLISEGIFVLRRGLEYVPNLKQCGIHPRVIAHLLELKAGLVLVAGGFSSGKTTTASAYVVEYVLRNSGLGLTLEDSPELPLTGFHGRGRIIQVGVKRSEIDKRSHDMMRSTYDLLMFSELRGGLMTLSALQTSAAGRLIIATVHGDNIPNSLSRTVSLAGGVNLSGDTGALSNLNLLADSLKMVIFMSEFQGGGYGPTSYLVVGDSARDCIRRGNFRGLDNCIDTTMNRLRSNAPLPLAD